MPIVGYTTIGGGLVGKDRETMRRYRWLERSAVSKKRLKYSRELKTALPGRSLLNQIASAWGLLSGGVKGNWGAAGNVIGLSGYAAYVQDKSYRIKQEIGGDATPSTLHQYKVGHINIPESAGDTHFRQTGEGGLTLPASLNLKYKSDLTADPVNGQFIKIRFKYTYNEGAGDLTQIDEISLDLSSAWGTASISITSHTGLLGPWWFEIETHAVKGDFWFDNTYIMSADGVLTRDSRCNHVAKRWQLVKYPAGVLIESVYPTGGAL